MKFQNLFTLLLTLYRLIDVLCHTQNDSAAPLAIASILSYLAKNSWTVDIIFCGDSDTSSGRLADSILRQSTQASAVQVSKCDKWKFSLNTSSILLFDSLTRFREIAPQIIWQNDPKVCFKHLVSVPNMTVGDLETVRFAEGFHFDCVNFLANKGEKSIDLVQNDMSSERACRVIRWNTYNRFHKTTMRWNHTDFYPDKYQDLHGCELVIGEPRFFNADPAGYIITALSRVRNFKILRYEHSFGGNEPVKFDILAQFISTGVRTTHGAVSSLPLRYATAYFVVPPGEPIGQLEKMFMMFNFDVWMAIVATLLIALVSIQVINLMPRYVRNLFYGSEVTSPTLNLAETFLAGGQIQLPSGDFARFLLMMFIIFSLIIRTCHQSTLFQLLQSDFRRPRMASLEQLAANDFSYLGHRPLETMSGFQDLGFE